MTVLGDEEGGPLVPLPRWDERGDRQESHRGACAAVLLSLSLRCRRGAHAHRGCARGVLAGLQPRLDNSSVSRLAR
jgi:hypothetical protein